LKIGVRFPEYIKEIFSLNDDENPEIYFQYPLQRYVCDYVDIDRKIVYAINGDFWHGNPLLYEEKKLTKIQKFNISRDINRRIFLEKNGYKVCVIWESEIEWNKELVIEKIRATRKTVNPPDLHSGNTAFDSLVAHSDWSEKLKSLWFKKPKGRPSSITEKECEYCKNKFRGLKRKKYCSSICSNLSTRKVDRPNADELNKMLWETPTQQIAKLYGVSDKAVEKWAKIYGINKPPRGYWAKLKSGKN
jgi:very-short-patch-repair endonuclease